WLARKPGMTKPPPWSKRRITSVAPVACSMAPKAPGLALGDADGGAADGDGVALDAPVEQAATRIRIAGSAARRARSDMPPGRRPSAIGSPDEIGSGMGLDGTRIFLAMSSGLRA